MQTDSALRTQDERTLYLAYSALVERAATVCSAVRGRRAGSLTVVVTPTWPGDPPRLAIFPADRIPTAYRAALDSHQAIGFTLAANPAADLGAIRTAIREWYRRESSGLARE